MLAALIECKPVARRRPRQNENVAELHVYSYSYEVNVVRDAAAVPIQFCTKALVSVFGITESRVKRIRSSVGKEEESSHAKSTLRLATTGRTLAHLVTGLSDDKVHLFTYDETVGKKGADKVCSMLYFYFTQVLSEEVSTLELFCDFCPGQNKHWTMLRFLHSLVVHQQQFIRIRITFPICAHSYMECDGDMVAINQKPRVETPIGWVQQFEGARKSPSPFNVVAVQQDTFLQMTNHVKVLYKATPQFPTRPIREKFSQETTQGSSSTVLIRMGLLKHLSCQTSWQKRSSPAATSLPYLSRENSSDSGQIQGLADPGDLLLGNRSAVL
ncbi:hypothetical protein RRG08_026736 [Elysia crispata]|uniref:Uncharacterized protein n=1 Tax=Elysia crispata TaxID=231223 RepID=A0AAE1E3T9_9GAST|nr:hypothetical protein RRG08_026736 [Elysia crispata]